MRAKRIAAQVKAWGYAELWSVTDADGVVRQWISTSAAAYPVDGMPFLQVANLPALLSLSEKELDKIRMEQGEKPEYIDLRDVAVGEHIVDTMDITLCVGSQELQPVQAVCIYLYYGEWLNLRECGALLGIDHTAVLRTVQRGLRAIADTTNLEAFALDNADALSDLVYELIGLLASPALNKVFILFNNESICFCPYLQASPPFLCGN